MGRNARRVPSCLRPICPSQGNPRVPVGEKPEQGFKVYRWLKDDELIYVQGSFPRFQLVKRNLTTDAAQVLQGLTELVRTTESTRNLPYVFPSPDGTYIAWISPPVFDRSTLYVASVDGCRWTHFYCKTRAAYMSWSDDSKRCFCFLEGDGPLKHIAYSSIFAVNTENPASLTLYPDYLPPGARAPFHPALYVGT